MNFFYLSEKSAIDLISNRESMINVYSELFSVYLAHFKNKIYLDPRKLIMKVK